MRTGQAVVEQLKVILLDKNLEVSEANPEAYALLLQARYVARGGSVKSYEKAVEIYEQALALDPCYAAAWTGLAGIYTEQAGWGERPFAEGFNLARQAANKALSIDPNYARAHATLGVIAMQHDSDLSASARQFERALALEPGNLTIIGLAAGLLSNLGHLEQAITMMEYVTARDPVNSEAHANLAYDYFRAERWDEAIAAERTALMLSPNSVPGHFLIGNALLFKDEAEDALEAMRQETSEVWRMLGLVMAHHALSETELSNTVLAELIDKHGRQLSYNIAYVLAYRNEPDRAFEWLDKAEAYGDAGLAEITVDPRFGNLHGDPRWLPFLARLGKMPTQLENIQFELKLPQ